MNYVKGTRQIAFVTSGEERTLLISTIKKVGTKMEEATA